ncbi:hypothetical protein MLC35_05250 [Sulfurimonas sp. NW7]|uniref:hypothetical protein n=1 Tax=Sulfurimonas sp. NW7 TaxID=2922727 RepID=UPI003DAA2654
MKPTLHQRLLNLKAGYETLLEEQPSYKQETTHILDVINKTLSIPQEKLGFFEKREIKILAKDLEKSLGRLQVLFEKKREEDRQSYEDFKKRFEIAQQIRATTNNC